MTLTRAIFGGMHSGESGREEVDTNGYRLLFQGLLFQSRLDKQDDILKTKKCQGKFFKGLKKVYLIFCH